LDQASDNLKRARQALGRKQAILAAAQQTLDSLLLSAPRPTERRIAEAKRNVAEAERDVAKAEWDLSRVDLDFAQARNAPDTELEQKRKTSETLKAVFEGLALEPTSGQPAFPAGPHPALYAM
jgi:septal ring factor EnvC (AmiA/AmiB activator)